MIRSTNKKYLEQKMTQLENQMNVVSARMGMARDNATRNRLEKQYLALEEKWSDYMNHYRNLNNSFGQNPNTKGFSNKRTSTTKKPAKKTTTKRKTKR